MKRLQILIFSGALLFLVSGARAQNQQGQGNDTQSTDPNAPVAPLPPQDTGDSGNRQAPQPAGRALSIYGSGDVSGDAQPDQHTLTGDELVGYGSLTGNRTLFDPSYHFSEAVDNGVVQGRLDSVTSIGGSVSLDQHWSRYHLTAQYSGAQIFYAPDSSFSVAYHGLGVAQEIRWRRWALHLRDDLNISPQANFGGLYTGSTNFGGQNNVLTGLSPNISIGETILTGQADHINNTTSAGIDLSISRRSTVTVTGAYGILRYFNPGYIDSYQSNAGVGYNYAFSSKNTIAVSYGFGRSSYAGAGSGVTQNQIVNVSYGRKITGRLAFQVSVGPQYVQILQAGAANSQYWTWAFNTSLGYTLSRASSVSFAYSHGVSGGSGVFAGSENDTLTAGYSHRFTRFWNASVNGGYSRNTNLVSGVGTANQFSNWYGGASLGRQIGREINLNMNYGYQQQTNGVGACPVLSCGTPVPEHSVASISIDWHPLAIPLR